MRRAAIAAFLTLCAPLGSAELESRVLTHYLPQDDLEAALRKEGWTDLTLKVAGGVRKGDTLRVWAGGSIDRGNGDFPSQHVNGPDGAAAPTDVVARLALSPQSEHAYALLVKIEGKAQPAKCATPGKPLELKLTKDNEKVALGFNDEKGRYHDNRLGRGKRHELDPLWVRIEVVRTVVD